jgi:hypothetical protein
LGGNGRSGMRRRRGLCQECFEDGVGLNVGISGVVYLWLEGWPVAPLRISSITR